MIEPPVSTTGTLAQPPARRPMSAWSLFLVLILFYVVFRARIVVEIGLLAFLYATIIERPVVRLERRGIPRAAAIILVDLAIVAAIVAPALAIAPAAAREIDRFRREEPARLHELDAQWATSSNPILHGPGRQAVERALKALESPSPAPSAPAVLTALEKTVLRVIAVLACLVMAYFYLLEKPFLRQTLLENIQPGSRLRVAATWDAVEESIGGWLRSRIILGVIVGIITIIAFGALRLPYWPLLGLLAGLTEPIPILGPWIGGIPAVFLALTVSPVKAVIVALFILGRQMLVDAVLVPRVTRDAVGLSPLTVFAAVLAGTELIGPAGAFLAIPLAAAVQILIVDALAARRQITEPRPALRWRWLLNPEESVPDVAGPGDRPTRGG
jgi:predicted PurR-regulated permease PerM